MILKNGSWLLKPRFPEITTINYVCKSTFLFALSGSRTVVHSLVTASHRAEITMNEMKPSSLYNYHSLILTVCIFKILGYMVANSWINFGVGIHGHFRSQKDWFGMVGMSLPLVSQLYECGPAPPPPHLHSAL